MLRPPHIPELCFRNGGKAALICRFIDKLALTVVGGMRAIVAIANVFDVEDGFLSMGAAVVLPNASDSEGGDVFELSDSKDLEHTTKCGYKPPLPTLATVGTGIRTCPKCVLQLTRVFSNGFDLFRVRGGFVRHRGSRRRQTAYNGGKTE